MLRSHYSPNIFRYISLLRHPYIAHMSMCIYIFLMSRRRTLDLLENVLDLNRSLLQYTSRYIFDMVIHIAPMYNVYTLSLCDVKVTFVKMEQICVGIIRDKYYKNRK